MARIYVYEFEKPGTRIENVRGLIPCKDRPEVSLWVDLTSGNETLLRKRHNSILQGHYARGLLARNLL